MIQIKWIAIKRDVDRQTYKLAKVRITDELPEIQNEAQSDDSNTDSRMVMRWAEEGNALVKAFMKDRISQATPEDTNTDELDMELTEWEYELAPGRFTTDEKSLAMLIHRFVVYYILWRWVTTAFPLTSGGDSLANGFKATMDEVENGIKEELYSFGIPKKYKRSLTEDSVKVIYTDE